MDSDNISATSDSLYLTRCNSEAASDNACLHFAQNESANATNLATRTAGEYEHHYVAIAFATFAFLLLVGIYGNVLVIVIVSRMKKMKTPTNCYLVSLAVADCLVLISAPLPALPELFFAAGRWLYGSAMCSVLVFLQYLAVNASSLTICAFTLERYVNICHPMTAQRFSRYARASRVVVCIWMFSILYCSAWLYLAVVRKIALPSGEERYICTFRLSRQQYATIYVVDLILFYCLPLVCACVLYGLIARTLFRRKHSFACKEALRPSASSSLVSRTNSSRAHDGTHDKRAQIVKMLVVITLLFAILWMPYRVWVVYNSFAAAGQQFGNIWISFFARTLVFTNSTINPLLYSAFSKKFRQAFIFYLTCKRGVHTGSAAANGSSSMSTTL